MFLLLLLFVTRLFTGVYFTRRVAQVLYFDRYTRLLAPGLDVLADDRLEMQPRRTPDSGGVVDV